jgi:aspartate/methionine/tyrosine aminotransferase
MRKAMRMEDLGTETAFEAAARAGALERAGRDIVHLHLGEPDFETPGHVIEAAARAMAEGHTHYAPPLGLPRFREAVAVDAARRRGVTVSPESVVITPGAKPIMAFAMLALVDPGEEVIVPDPGFPIYESMARFVGGRPVSLPLRAADGFRVDLDELGSLITSRTRLIVINSPQNPTGAVLTRTDVEGIAALALSRDLIVLADEVYGRIVHEGEHHSILAVEGMAERTIVLDGLSKSHAMTGWRLGWGIVPRSLITAFERLLINTVSCTATFAQIAGAAALEGPQGTVEAMVAELRARRDLVVSGLSALPGVWAPTPSGAFYAFPDVSETGMTGRQLADRLLEEAGVSVVAGDAFGAQGRSSVRVSYANSQANLRIALARMAELLEASRA